MFDSRKNASPVRTVKRFVNQPVNFNVNPIALEDLVIDEA